MWRPQNIALTLALAVSLIMGALYLAESSESENLLAKLNATELRLQALSRESELLRSELEQVKRWNSVTYVPENGASTSPRLAQNAATQNESRSRSKTENPRNAAADWRSRFQLGELEEFTQLTNDQRERAKASFLAESQGKTGEPLTDIIGEQLAKDFEQYRETNRQARLDRQIDGEVYRLSRTLSLTAEQEEQTKNIMREVSQEVREIARQVLPFNRVHTPNEMDPAEAMKTVRDIQETRRTMLNDRLSKVFSEEQFNKLLEDQASAPPQGFWGM